MQEFPGARLAGQGTTGFVFAVEQGGMSRALKLRYDKIDHSTTVAVQDAVSAEVDVLRTLDHPSIVRTYGVIRGPLPSCLVCYPQRTRQHAHTRFHARDTRKQSRRYAHKPADIHTCAHW